uniref:Uncharacterized protein n=1 Tax=Arundo donax TaxID=35708 RepID=A0A0A9C6I6_ARUDO
MSTGCLTAAPISCADPHERELLCVYEHELLHHVIVSASCSTAA